MPKVVGPIRSANHAVVAGSASTSGSAAFQKSRQFRFFSRLRLKRDIEPQFRHVLFSPMVQ
jgi:hypothetical protein